MDCTSDQAGWISGGVPTTSPEDGGGISCAGSVISTEAAFRTPQKALSSFGSEGDAAFAPDPSKAHWMTSATNSKIRAFVAAELTNGVPSVNEIE